MALQKEVALQKLFACLLLILLATFIVPATAAPQQIVFVPEIRTTATIYPNTAIAPHLYDWSFDGVDDYVEVPDSPSLNPSQLTIEVLIRGYVEPSGDKTEAVIAKRAQYGIYWDHTEHKTLGFFIRDTSLIFHDVVHPSKPAVNTWLHYIGAFDGRYLKLYENGELINIYDTGGVTITTTTNGVGIGDNLAGTQYCQMDIALARIYNRALTEDEIVNAYNSHVVNASGLVLFLDPTFYNGTHYLDLSGNDNHGTPYGGVKRVEAEKKWLWVVYNLSYISDGKVHLMYFPVGWVVRFKYGGEVVKEVNITSDDVVVDGLVLPAEYTVEVGQYYALMPVTLNAFTNKASLQINESVYIYFVPRNYTGFISGLQVNVSIVKPDSTTVNLTMVEDPYNNVYYCLFSDTNLIGTYLVIVKTEIYGFPAEARTRFEVGTLEQKLDEMLAEIVAKIENTTDEVVSKIISVNQTLLSVNATQYWVMMQSLAEVNSTLMELKDLVLAMKNILEEHNASVVGNLTELGARLDEIVLKIDNTTNVLQSSISSINSTLLSVNATLSQKVEQELGEVKTMLQTLQVDVLCLNATLTEVRDLLYSVKNTLETHNMTVINSLSHINMSLAEVLAEIKNSTDRVLSDVSTLNSTLLSINATLQQEMGHIYEDVKSMLQKLGADLIDVNSSLTELRDLLLSVRGTLEAHNISVADYLARLNAAIDQTNRLCQELKTLSSSTLEGVEDAKMVLQAVKSISESIRDVTYLVADISSDIRSLVKEQTSYIQYQMLLTVIIAVMVGAMMAAFLRTAKGTIEKVRMRKFKFVRRVEE